MIRTARRAAIAALTALAAVAAIIAVDLTPPATAQSEESTGRIVARLLADGRVEFGWQPSGGSRVLPTQRYFPADITHNRWLRSSPVEVDDEAIGRIEARQLEDGRIEFAFTPTDGERILTDARYFPTSARPNRWLRSTEITIGTSPIPFIVISAGIYSTCAIREDKTIACWGLNDVGQTDAPEGTFTTIVGFGYTDPGPAYSGYRGSDYRCALRTTGEIECWGRNDFGQTDAPGGMFTVVSAGWVHACGLRETGEIECWGSNTFSVGLTDAPQGSFTAISAGSTHTCAIAETFERVTAGPEAGEIECWGASAEGEWGGIHRGETDAPTGRFTAINSVGKFSGGDGGFPCAISESGEIECWGHHPYEGKSYFTPTPAGSFTAISAGHLYYCGLREGGAIACWGDSSYGQTDAPEGSFTAISTGYDHACAIRESGALECWGDSGGSNYYGESIAPVGIFTTVSAGYNYTCAIHNTGEIECWGQNGYPFLDDTGALRIMETGQLSPPAE